jgi:hypothetical protein
MTTTYIQKERVRGKKREKKISSLDQVAFLLIMVQVKQEAEFEIKNLIYSFPHEYIFNNNRLFDFFLIIASGNGHHS